MTDGNDADWVSRFAGEVIAAAAPTTGRQIVCASGLSPSGPIHLGNLREVLTPHLVAEEIRRRGYGCVHLLSWDDYDRLRKIPAGMDPTWAEHIGKPLSAVPAPPGSQRANWAEHYKAPMIEAMRGLGVEVRQISQTEMYTSGAYRDQILLAMRRRERIDEVLARYRTKKQPAGDATAAWGQAEGSGAAAEDDGSTAAGYFPYRPYCSVCERDLTAVVAYDEASTRLRYRCECGHTEEVVLREHNRGKLVWKVDWPMRWAYEGVDFEPSGVDHSSPGSSFAVGTQLVREVFGARPPIGPMYAFVGISGMAKMSSSRGGVPTALDALEVMEPPLLRWLYVRRRPNQAITVSFDQEIHRLYDEWDALTGKVADGTASPPDAAAYHRAAETTTAGRLVLTPRPVTYRTLASIVDVTTADPEQMLRILHDIDPAHPIRSLDDVRPRLDCAQHWIFTHLPTEQRTRVRSEPDEALLVSLDDAQRRSVRLLIDGMEEHWSLDGLTVLVYGVPKRQLGLPMDVKPTPELKAAQRAFFALLYRLLVGRDTGPRLPTLLLAVGAKRVRYLLGG